MTAPEPQATLTDAARIRSSEGGFPPAFTGVRAFLVAAEAGPAATSERATARARQRSDRSIPYLHMEKKTELRVLWTAPGRPLFIPGRCLSNLKAPLSIAVASCPLPCYAPLVPTS